MISVKTETAQQSFRIIALSHVNVTVAEELESAAKHFYGQILGLKQIEKPVGPRQTVGAWYDLGNVELHLSVASGSAASSDRHVCYVVEDVSVAESHLRDAGVEIIPDPRPVSGNKRFYVRDPGGNLLEIAGT